jgi:hypothetical protein
LRIWGMRSDFIHTLVMYTTVVTVYMPAITLLNWPVTYRLFATIQLAKQQHASMLGAFLLLFRSWTNTPGGTTGLLFGLPIVIAQAIGIVSLVMFCESVVQWYDNDRYRSYVAIASASLVNIVVTYVVIVPFQLGVYFAFIGS